MLNCLDTTQKDALNAVCSNPVLKTPVKRFDTFNEFREEMYYFLTQKWSDVIDIARSIENVDYRLNYEKRSYGASCKETGARLDVKHSKWLHMFQFGYDVYCVYFEDTQYGMIYIICK